MRESIFTESRSMLALIALIITGGAGIAFYAVYSYRKAANRRRRKQEREKRRSRRKNQT
jgi:uncharacterized membrane protein